MPVSGKKNGTIYAYEAFITKKDGVLPIMCKECGNKDFRDDTFLRFLAADINVYIARQTNT